MQSDWDSLFFRHTPHADQLPDHDARLLRDVGLVRTETGALAFAEDPTRLVETPPHNRPRGWWPRWKALGLKALVTGEDGIGQRRLNPF